MREPAGSWTRVPAPSRPTTLLYQGDGAYQWKEAECRACEEVAHLPCWTVRLLV